MKKITEMTEQEILALNGDDLNKLVDYECALKGIPFVESPEKQPLTTIPEKELVLYSPYGFTYYFKDKKSADKLAALIEELRPQMYSTSYIGNDYANKYAKVYDKADYNFKNIGDVSKEEVYSYEQLVGLKDILQSNTQKEQGYKRALKEYDEYETARGNVAEPIMQIYYDVVNKHHEMNRLKSKFEYYLHLAEGNEKTAMKFLKDAYVVDAQTEEFILPSVESNEDEGYQTTAKSEGCAN